MSKLIPLGPSLTGTLVTPDLEATVAAYCDYLYTTVLEDTEVSDTQAVLWGKPRLAGSRIVTLHSATGYPWLRVIHSPDVTPARPFLELGWMALEVLVDDVDKLAVRLADSPFEIYRPPADLDVSDAIRAMQVIGPAGEVLYLTQVNDAVEPFDIPRAQCPVDRLFIPVSSCLRRDEALAVYSKLGAKRKWTFDTRISSVNKAHGLDLSLRHPVATVQLAGQSMVEIDQLGVAKSRPPSGGLLPAGIAMVSFVFDNIDNMGLKPVSPTQTLGGKLYGGQRVVACRGAGGELIELIEAAA
ncbi:MAG: hypothetical protein ABJ308_03625 [Halieaceae bacterium]